MRYLVHSGNCCIDNLALERFKYDSLILDSKLRESYPRHDLSSPNINLLMIEYTDDISVLTGTCALDIGKEFMFQVGSHIRPKEGWVER